jgi:hypothetical protein
VVDEGYDVDKCKDEYDDVKFWVDFWKVS